MVSIDGKKIKKSSLETLAKYVSAGDFNNALFVALQEEETMGLLIGTLSSLTDSDTHKPRINTLKF